MKREIYWNLHHRIWSVRKPHGRVTSHARHVIIYDPKFVVQPAGRAKVLKERKKNVHAFVRGLFHAATHMEIPTGICASYARHVTLPNNQCVQVTYNPYRADHFTICGTGQAIYEAQWCLLSFGSDGIYGQPEWSINRRPIVWVLP
jgi:hypothetical protein